MPKDSSMWKLAYKSYKVPVTHKPKALARRKPEEPMELQRELLNLNEKLKLVKQWKARKKEILLLLEQSGQKVMRSAYMEKPITLYALRLEDGCWYIGSSRNPKRRFTKHRTGKGAKWTALHKPTEIVEVRETGSNDDQKVCLLEDDMTIEYAMKYGADKVRGGGYCQTKPSWPDIVVQSELTIY